MSWGTCAPRHCLTCVLHWMTSLFLLEIFTPYSRYIRVLFTTYEGLFVVQFGMATTLEDLMFSMSVISKLSVFWDVATFSLV